MQALREMWIGNFSAAHFDIEVACEGNWQSLSAMGKRSWGSAFSFRPLVGLEIQLEKSLVSLSAEFGSIRDVLNNFHLWPLRDCYNCGGVIERRRCRDLSPSGRAMGTLLNLGFSFPTQLCVIKSSSFHETLSERVLLSLSSRPSWANLLIVYGLFGQCSLFTRRSGLIVYAITSVMMWGAMNPQLFDSSPIIASNRSFVLFEKAFSNFPIHPSVAAWWNGTQTPVTEPNF